MKRKYGNYLTQSEVVAGLKLLGMEGDYVRDCWRGQCPCPSCGDSKTRFRVHENGMFFCSVCLPNYQTEEYKVRRSLIYHKIRNSLLK